RDRLQQPRNRARCPNPTEDQLNEMLSYLQERCISINSPEELMRFLKSLAKRLRPPLTKPLEFCDPSTGEVLSMELPDERSTIALDEVERQELQEFCEQQLMECLEQSIKQVLGAHINDLRQRPRYASLAPQVKPGLQLLYCQGMSQKAIALQLGMTNQSQVSRVLNQSELLNKVRRLTVGKLLESILDKARNLGLTRNLDEPDYLENLMQEIDAFVDEKVFHQAAAEIRTSKNRSMESLYARRLCNYLKNHTSEI
ncbi:MAG: hypothetical protein LDL41_22885, partial [Coleofasciculus sp. S288]|nr:hypothetical protein [Coleofasciculus sp. S288]